jgi:hypothetical protein
MFLGHFSLAFAAKRAAPSVSLGTLFLAAQFADLLWPTLVLLGFESLAVEPGATAVTPLNFVRYPYSHSLLALSFWALLLAITYVAVRKATLRVGAIIAALVLSHWFLDALSHRPDMPLTLAGSEKVGLALWNSVPATLTVELALFASGVGLYAASSRASSRRGAVSLWSLVAFLFVVYLVNVFGPPPPSAVAVAWSAQALWLLVFWAYRLDGHRRAACII